MKYCLLFLVLLTGCADVSSRMDDYESALSKVKPPVVQVQPIDREELRTDLLRGVSDKIDSSTTQSENRMQGVVNTQVDKMENKLVGVESRMNTELTGVKGDITGVKAELQTQITASAVMQTRLDAAVTVNAKLEADLKVALSVVNELKIQNAEFKAQAQVSANAQIGFNNSYQQQIQDLKASAGRDMNMLPANAVWIILGVCGGMLIVMLVGNVLGNASERVRFKQQTDLAIQASKQNAESEREERQASNNLLLEVLTLVPAAEASKIAGKVERLFKRPFPIDSHDSPT